MPDFHVFEGEIPKNFSDSENLMGFEFVTRQYWTLEVLVGSVRHGPGWPMGPRAGLGYGLGRASNLGISTGSGRARAESSIQITILFYTIKLIIHDKSSFLIHEQRSCKVNQPAFEVQTAE